MEADIWRGEKELTMLEYLRAPGVSKHALDDFARSPAFYMDVQMGRVKEVDKEHNRVGRCLHELFFERRESWVEEPLVWHDAKGNETTSTNTKECKEWRAEHADDCVLKRSQAEWIRSTVEMLRADKYVGLLPASGRFERSLFARCDNTGLLLKTRPDWMDGRGVFVDMKSTTDASTEYFSREIFKHRYHVQAGLCRMVARLLNMPFTHYYYLIVEKSDPPRVNVRELQPTALDLGMFTVEDQLEALAKCKTDGYWPDYSGDGERIDMIDVPVWAYTKLENDDPILMGGKPLKV